MIDAAAIKIPYAALRGVLNERGRRRFAAAEALAAGRGGIKAVSESTGIARSTIGYGLRELRGAPDAALAGRIRRKGAGRKPLVETDPTLLSDLETLVAPATRGDPMSPLRWTSKSLRKLAGALRDMGHRVGHDVVGALFEAARLFTAGRLQDAGRLEPRRTATRSSSTATVSPSAPGSRRSPSIRRRSSSVASGTAAASTGRPARPRRSAVHDFVDPNLGRASPYGIYDIADDKGWVSVGIDHDTAAFAVNAIRSWWTNMGQDRYPGATP